MVMASWIIQREKISQCQPQLAHKNSDCRYSTSLIKFLLGCLSANAKYRRGPHFAFAMLRLRLRNLQEIEEQ